MLSPCPVFVLSNRRSEAHEAAIDASPRLTGGVFLAPLLFSAISRSYKGIIAKFSVPSKLSIWHILTKEKLVSSDTLAINEVRVVLSHFGRLVSTYWYLMRNNRSTLYVIINVWFYSICHVFPLKRMSVSCEKDRCIAWYCKYMSIYWIFF